MGGEPDTSIAALQRPRDFVNLIDHHEGRIHFLRKLSSRLGSDPWQMIIRYKLPQLDGRDPEYAAATMDLGHGGPERCGSTQKRWVVTDGHYSGFSRD